MSKKSKIVRNRLTNDEHAELQEFLSANAAVLTGKDTTAMATAAAATTGNQRITKHHVRGAIDSLGKRGKPAPTSGWQLARDAAEAERLAKRRAKAERAKAEAKAAEAAAAAPEDNPEDDEPEERPDENISVDQWQWLARYRPRHMLSPGAIIQRTSRNRRAIQEIADVVEKTLSKLSTALGGCEECESIFTGLAYNVSRLLNGQSAQKELFPPHPPYSRPADDDERADYDERAEAENTAAEFYRGSNGHG